MISPNFMNSLCPHSHCVLTLKVSERLSINIVIAIVILELPLGWVIVTYYQSYKPVFTIV